MLRTMLNLECDGCGNPFPSCGNLPSAVDGAIYTPQMLREEAREQKGWKRPVINGERGDHCPRCAKKAQREREAQRAGK